MPEHEDRQRDDTGLEVQDHLPLQLTRLDENQVSAAQQGNLAAATSGLRAALGSRDATVEELARSYPPDQRPQGAVFEALRLVDTKLDHIRHLLEDQLARQEREGPEPLPVRVSLEAFRAGLPLNGEVHPERGEWYWVDCRLPGSPRVHFGAPAHVTEAERAAGEQGEDRYWVTLALANVTESEEKVLSEYIFRRHRQEVRQKRHPEEGGPD
ncbi:PilZ domain-containing protein [Thiohalorhabdus sp.]|uniref:PilZ domain-containing protein n=1 Tax=Thiohalorhabdus sp. TaxID=3094134 RepID=UPI002FC332E1